MEGMTIHSFQTKKGTTVDDFWVAVLSCTEWICLRHVLGRIFSYFSSHFQNRILIDLSFQTHTYLWRRHVA